MTFLAGGLIVGAFLEGEFLGGGSIEGGFIVGGLTTGFLVAVVVFMGELLGFCRRTVALVGVSFDFILMAGREVGGDIVES